MKKMMYCTAVEALEAANKLLAAYDLPICDYVRVGGGGGIPQFTRDSHVVNFGGEGSSTSRKKD